VWGWGAGEGGGSGRAWGGHLTHGLAHLTAWPTHYVHHSLPGACRNLEAREQRGRAGQRRRQGDVCGWLLWRGDHLQGGGQGRGTQTPCVGYVQVERWAQGVWTHTHKHKRTVYTTLQYWKKSGKCEEGQPTSALYLLTPLGGSRRKSRTLVLAPILRSRRRAAAPPVSPGGPRSAPPAPEGPRHRGTHTMYECSQRKDTPPAPDRFSCDSLPSPSYWQRLHLEPEEEVPDLSGPKRHR